MNEKKITEIAGADVMAKFTEDGDSAKVVARILAKLGYVQADQEESIAALLPPIYDTLWDMSVTRATGRNRR